MSFGAGERTRRIAFQQCAFVRNTLGQEVESFTTLCFARAAVRHGKGSERRENAMLAAEQPVTFIVRSCADARAITERDVIRMDDLLHDIKSITPTPDGAEIEFTCTVRKG